MKLFLVLFVLILWLLIGGFMAMEFAMKWVDLASPGKTKLGVLWNVVIAIGYIPAVAFGFVFGPPIYLVFLLRTFWQLPLR